MYSSFDRKVGYEYKAANGGDEDLRDSANIKSWYKDATHYFETAFAWKQHTPQ
jgi:hypothetical protein